MNLGTWLAKQIVLEETNIKTIVAIYPGRFQPMGKHHAQTYKWLQSKFSDAYVATSGKMEIPKSPFSFAEKKKIINSYGIKNVVQVKNPYKAEEILKKYDPETTAAVFMVGKKDAQRLGGKFFRPWKGKAEVGYRDGAYTIIAPHVSLNVSGYGEMSGTTIRTALGDKSLEAKDKQKLFKGIFGHTKNYNLIVNKLEKLNETIERFCSDINITKLIAESSTFANTVGAEIDDGPRTFWGNQKSWRMFGAHLEKNINRGMKILNYISGDEEFFFYDTDYPNGPQGTVSYWPTGRKGKLAGSQTFGDLEGGAAFTAWKKHITKVAGEIGWEFFKWNKRSIINGNQQQLRIKLQDAASVACDECGNNYFIAFNIFRY